MDSTDSAARDVAAGEDGTPVQPPACSAVDSRCFICELDALREETLGKDDKASEFSNEELVYTVVGVRRRDSISDKFDDFMSVLLKLPGAKAAEEFQKTLEKDYLDDWERVFKLAKSKFRLTTCTKRNATYAVGFFENVSTDPGLTDDDVEKCEHALVKARATAKTLDTEIENTDKQLTIDKKAATDRKTELDALPEDPPKKGGKKGKRGPAKVALQRAETKRDQTEAKLTKAKEKRTAKDAEIAELEAQLKEKSATREKIAMFGKGEEGGLEAGRGQLNTGVYRYSVGVHRGGGKLDHSHPAFVMRDSPTNAYRYYAADWILENGMEELKGTKLACLIHAGEEVAEAASGEVALEEGPPKKVVIKRDGKVIDVEKGSTLAVYGAIGGANLHRGHNAHYDEASKRIVYRDGGAKVKGFSLGCQVHHDFDSFNAFLRLGQLSKRYICVSQKKNLVSCARLVAGNGADLSNGERKLEEAYGRGEFLRFDASTVEAEKKTDAAEKKVLEKKKSTWKPELATRLGVLRAKPESDLSKLEKPELAVLEAKEWRSEDEKELTRLNAEIEELDAESALTKAEQEELAAEEAEKKATTAVAKLEADNLKKKDKDKLDEVALRLKNKKTYEDLESATQKLLAAKKQVAELKTKVKRFHAFLRERCNFFGADFIRECEPARKCESMTRYILVQADQDVANDLTKRFQRKPQVEWDGKLALKQS